MIDLGNDYWEMTIDNDLQVQYEYIDEHAQVPNKGTLQLVDNGPNGLYLIRTEGTGLLPFYVVQKLRGFGVRNV